LDPLRNKGSPENAGKKAGVDFGPPSDPACTHMPGFFYETGTLFLFSVYLYSSLFANSDSRKQKFAHYTYKDKTKLK